jgi:hypothetical protein
VVLAAVGLGQERESAVERARSEEEKRRAEAERVARKREQEEEMRRAAEENRARLQLKMEERQREQDENLRIARQQVSTAPASHGSRPKNNMPEMLIIDFILLFSSNYIV